MEKEKHDGIHSRMLNHGREAASALVLGTAQLGLDYGVANRTGRPRPEEALEIVRRAWEGGIRYFDTAQAYGESETVLGRCFREMMGPARISSVIKEIDASLDRLGVEELWGFMLHRESSLDMGEEALSEMIRELKKEPRFRYFGVSVYSPEYALRALELMRLISSSCRIMSLTSVPFSKGFSILQGKSICSEHIFAGSPIDESGRPPGRVDLFKVSAGIFCPICLLSSLAPEIAGPGLCGTDCPWSDVRYWGRNPGSSLGKPDPLPGSRDRPLTRNASIGFQ
ncbi:MAG: aldo/keto reductase [Deltaproteobacteria bacterium]|nr:aldo/keto reductase [Deltaproteobacteria bacterium]